MIISLSQNATEIILARVIQGIGSRILVSSSLALIMDNYKDKMCSQAIAYYGATAWIGKSMVALWLTNIMHQLGGPVGLSVIILLSSRITNIVNYYHQIM